MATSPPEGQNPAFAVNGQLHDILSYAPDLTNFRIALRSWFTSYLTQTDDHVNHCSLQENIWFYEVLQDWLDSPVLVSAAVVQPANPLN